MALLKALIEIGKSECNEMFLSTAVKHMITGTVSLSADRGQSVVIVIKLLDISYDKYLF